MAFFFTCNTTIPIDWPSYGKQIYTLLENSIRCLRNKLKLSSTSLPKELIQQIDNLIDDYEVSIGITLTNLETLINTLSENPTGSVCFDKCLFNNYITSYEISKSILNKINILLTTGGSEIASDLNVHVDVSNVLLEPSIKPKQKITKCAGVYIKQMDYSSEFIGRVTITEGEVKIDSGQIESNTFNNTEVVIRYA